ncbi:hypothetical protein IP91_02588 [Pseudoduganella lurida]|uniref:P27 family phage terminase small subunit n=1 Tax=Pseudoduganella lurida TaxID=1036180 RepID=A0A562R7Z1_9BURK|nr:P27 family phage terminase small subunit [Pseudoduganella lurida]TWI65181.1 hypothetical protein IP91_02588 [Pseudoduganella lurida]
MDMKSSLGTSLPAVGAHAVRAGADVSSPDAPPVIGLTGQEREVYDYICESLRAAGIEHVTAGMPIAIIVRTFVDWIAASKECDEKGRSQTSKTGWSTPTPWADDEKRLKMELGQWLPKACLTIPSLARVRKDTGIQGGQDDLFGDLVNHAMSSPARR